jgi:hypothetical protein
MKFLLSIPSARQHFNTYPPTFIIGAARSGTTLTLKLFENQPLITTLFEPCIFWDKAFSPSEDDTYQDNLNWLGLQALRYLYYREITPEKPYLVVKDPRDSIRIDSLNRLFPKAKFIHIIRDGRDVVASMMKTFENTIYYLPGEKWPHVRIPNYKNLLDNPSHIKAAIQWSYCIETSLKQLQKIEKERQLSFYYEDLLDHPKTIIEKIVRFAYPQLTMNHQFLDNIVSSISNQVKINSKRDEFFEFQKNISWTEKMKQFSSFVKDDAGSGTTSDTIRAGRWRSELDNSIVAEIEPIIGSTLKKLGYE